MAGRYKAYPEYKDSGVEWLGRIPKKWKSSRHKYVANFQKGKNPSVLFDSNFDGAIRYLSMDYLRGNSDSTFAKAEKNTYMSQDGQVLLIWDGSNAGEFVKGKLGIVSSTMAASELISKIYQRFYWYACVCLEPEMRKHANGMGIPHVNGQELKGSIIPLPEEFEQTQIANFLDHETAKIDKLIEKQQQLIRLLEEKRQAVISHAITKGLNPSAPMKDSGIEWLGQVPAHWGVGFLKRFTITLRDGTHNPPPREDGDYRLLSVRNIINGVFVIREDDRTMGQKAFLELQRSYTVEENDIVLAIVGGTIGKSAIVRKMQNITVQRSLAIIRINKAKLNPQFLNFFLQTNFVQSIINQIAEKYSAQPGIYLEDVSNIRVVFPPKNEQNFICNYLSRKLGMLEAIAEKGKKQIELFKEKRSALISAAVTGKIDVRDWFPHQKSSS